MKEDALRPTSLDEFVGQENVKRNLKVFLKASKLRKEPLEHTLFVGPPGLGKTTLAFILASELGVNIHTSSGASLSKVVDLVGILTSLEEGDILFIDEIHRLPKHLEEYLYTAMEDFAIDVVLDKGPGARTFRIDLNRFTLVGATTRMGLLSKPLVDRFGIVLHLDYYTFEEIQAILKQTASKLSIQVDEASIKEIARRSRGTPRVANRLLRRVRDFAHAQGKSSIDIHTTLEAFQSLGVDALGLDELDKRILRTIIEKFSGGPVGIRTIANALNEEPETIEQIYEPYLIRMGLLERTSRGRKATLLAYKHLGYI